MGLERRLGEEWGTDRGTPDIFYCNGVTSSSQILA